MPSLKYRILENILKRINIRNEFLKPEAEIFAHAAAFNRKHNTLPAHFLKSYRVREQTDNGMVSFVISRKDTEPKEAILLLHGGAGFMEPTVFHFNFLRSLLRNTEAEIWFPFYPLAPKSGEAEALQALSLLYRKMEALPFPVLLIGDSAGANLALSLCAMLLYAKRRRPDGMVVLSPAAGVDSQDYFEKMSGMADRDFLLSPEIIRLVRKYWVKENADTDGNMSGNGAGNSDRGMESRPDVRRYSASRIDYSAFPPLLVLYGTEEIFCSCLQGLLRRMKQQCKEIRVVRGRGLCHDWALVSGYPEGRRALKTILTFLHAFTEQRQ